jgi:TonB family protein
MDAKRTRRLLIVAFALSLLLHALFATAVHWRLPSPSEEEQVIHVQRITARSITPHLPTPPPPTPKPAPVPTRPAPHRIASKPAGKPSREGTRAAGGSAGGVPTPAPTVAAAGPTPAPCSSTDLPPHITTAPAPPDIAPQARAAATSGTTKVHVSLDADGNVTNAAVVQTSGNTSLDLVALEMAKSAAYAPAYHDCKAVASTYDFSARFVAW